jgi:hypothetical protein
LYLGVPVAIFNLFMVSSNEEPDGSRAVVLLRSLLLPRQAIVVAHLSFCEAGAEQAEPLSDSVRPSRIAGARTLPVSNHNLHPHEFPRAAQGDA